MRIDFVGHAQAGDPIDQPSLVLAMHERARQATHLVLARDHDIAGLIGKAAQPVVELAIVDHEGIAQDKILDAPFGGSSVTHRALRPIRWPSVRCNKSRTPGWALRSLLYRDVDPPVPPISTTPNLL